MRSIVTVLTPAASRDLATLDEVKLDIGVVGTDDDDFLAMAISRASAIIETYCQRVFTVEEVRETFYDHPVSSYLYLKRKPLIEVTDPATGYDVDLSAGLLIGGFSGDFAIDYTAGYEQIPLEIRGATSEIVKALQFNRTRDPMLRSENILSGLYAYTLFDADKSNAGTATQVANLLNAYRSPVVA